MGKWNKKKSTYWPTARPTKTTPTDKYDNTKAAIVFFDQSNLNEMRDECIDAAKTSEWQIHHWDLRVQLSRDGITVSLFFPMAFYNFDQEVGPSSVEWETADSDKESEATREAALANRTKLFQSMPIFVALKESGYDVEFDFGDFGSIHRHPGSFGFSSIDTRKDPDNPGVIYRRKEADNLWQIDSVMTMSQDKDSDVKIYTTECRILDINPSEDGGVEGTYTEIPTVTVIRNKEIDLSDSNDGFENVFGKVEKNTLDRYKVIGQLKPYPLLVTILDMFFDAEYECDTSNVKAERITQKTYGSYGTYGGKSLYGSNWWDDEYGYGYGYSGKTTKTFETRSDLESRLMDSFPMHLHETEKEFVRTSLGRIGYGEFKKLVEESEQMYEEELGLYA